MREHYNGNELKDFLQTNGSQVLQRADNNYNLKHFTENEIRHMTKGYSTLLGKGAFGNVYKGTLDQSSVAVKRYIHGTEKKEFAKEVIVHSQVNHKNVVRLLGCCTEANALMIVMEFITNGNLDTFLHSSSSNVRVPFPLDKRLDISIQVAEALWCMHSMYSPVLHGDIKPANILLDENLSPKISDFGIARLLCANGAQHTGNVIGSIGYLDPAFCEKGILTPKSDVYSFGVVLLEIITRKKGVDGKITLAQCFNDALKKGENVIHMFDEEINNTENMKFLRDIGDLAAKCLRKDVQMRPGMVEVVIRLRMIWEALQGEQGNVSLQHSSVPRSSIPSNKVEPAANQLGNLNIFGREDIKRITRNYSMTFREELHQRLYSGVLSKGHPVIVKQLRTCSETEREIFLKTMSILSRKNHDNIVNVIGFHIGKSISECVYESCCDLSESRDGISFSNRNLYEIISSTEKPPLHVRLSIAVQCAEGLVHIHSLLEENNDSSGGTGLTGNFRCSNIFLDKNFVPKVFNDNLCAILGLSVVQTVSTFSVNDHGSQKYYLDPRDVHSPMFNPKTDVYSFGVVLLELLTWKTVRYKSHGRVHVLTTDFLDTYRADRKAIQFLGTHVESFLHEAIAIAVECLQPDLEKRPQMSDVLCCLRIFAGAQSIRSKFTGGGNAEPSRRTNPTRIIDPAKTLPASTISLDELKETTRNFSDGVLIGEGSSSRVYFGVLKDGQKSAIQKIHPYEGIQLQVPAISEMWKHDNVVQLLGYFFDEKVRVLAYEYASRGSLYDILHGKWGKGAQGPPLSWLQRVKIAVSAAKGLEFLHEKVKPPIIHTNIKSSNILIFDDDVAKIGDLGISRRLPPKSPDYRYDRICNQFADCVAPECQGTGETSKKSDIYSFGIVLLELLTGRRVIDRTLPFGTSLVTWAIPRLTENKVKQCVDPRLGMEYPPKAIAKMAAVAALCLQYEAEYRPEMSIVVKALVPLLNAK